MIKRLAWKESGPLFAEATTRFASFVVEGWRESDGQVSWRAEACIGEERESFYARSMRDGKRWCGEQWRKSLADDVREPDGLTELWRAISMRAAYEQGVFAAPALVALSPGWRELWRAIGFEAAARVALEEIGLAPFQVTEVRADGLKWWHL